MKKMKNFLLTALSVLALTAGTIGLVSCQEPNSGSPHEHSYTEKVTAPTCTTQGYTTYTCHCGDTYVDNYIGATGHRYGEWIIQIVPTTENDGSARRTCASCGGSEIQVLPGLVQGSDGIDDNSETAKESLFLVIILQIGIIALLILVFIMYLMFKKKTNMRDK